MLEFCASSVRARLLWALVFLALSLGASACSLVSDFGSYVFGSNDPSGDGGAGSSGDAGSSGVTGGAGSSGGGGSGMGGGGAGAGSGGAGGMGGSAGMVAGAGGDTASGCELDTECGDPKSLQCVLGQCVLRRLPSGVWQSGGGGITRSSNFEVRVSVGAPGPMGTVKSARYQVTVGAGAGRP